MNINQLASQYVYWPEIDNKYQKNVDLSKVTLNEIHDILNEASMMNKEPIVHSIVTFYAINEALGKLRQQENDVMNKEHIALYKHYNDEIDSLSKKMFCYIFTICIMEARHCLDFKNVNEFKEKLKNKYQVHYIQAELDGLENNFYYNAQQKNLIHKIEDKSAIFKKVNFKKTYRHLMNLKEYKDLFKLYELVEPLSHMGGYDRDDVNEIFIPLLQNPQFCNLNLNQILSSLTRLFNHNNFSLNYGGRAWGKISEHCLNFITGKINAEVFVDQAFSLEHNGGQIFNKALIFKRPTERKVIKCDLHQIGNYDTNHPNEAQILLNMQHQGQLLSFLTKEIKEPNICNVMSVEGHKKFINAGYSQGYSQDNLTNYSDYSNFSTVIDFLHSNVDTLSDIQKDLLKSSRISSLIDQIKSLNILTPKFDSFAVFNNLRVGKSLVSLYPFNRFFHTLQDKLMYNFSHNEFTPSKIENININLPKKKKNVPFVFEFYDTTDIPQNKMTKEILGNKALGLAQMHDMDLPVPKAIVFPATNAESFYQKKTEWNKNLKEILPNLLSHFKDNDNNPLLVSVRSGSAISMPGMMDTILNVGIDNTNYQFFCDKLGRDIVNECAIKFMSLFTKSLLGIAIKYPNNIVDASLLFRETLKQHNIDHNKKGLFPLKSEDQIKWCLQAVFSSWHSERAVAYRNHQNISHDIGTAAIVQQMVFGNLNNNSCTGVAFSRDCISGEKGIIGEFLPKAQGEDVVSGAVTPLNIKDMPQHFPKAYKQLVIICERLEKNTGDIQDIEFTVENGELYILQKRKAVSSDIATIKLNQELMDKGIITKDKALSNIKVSSLITQDSVDSTDAILKFEGLIANPGILRGIVVRDEEEMQLYQHIFDEHKGHTKDKNFGWIFYASETSPDHAPIMIKTHGFITGNGGFTSHAAILSRSWKKPCVVGIGEDKGQNLNSGSLITLDATNGKIYEGLLPIQSNKNKSIKTIVKTVLDYHHIDLKTLKDNNPFDKIIENINSHETWMEKYNSCKFVKTEIKPNVSKFLKLGDKIAIMLLKAKEEKFNFSSEPIFTEKSPLSQNINHYGFDFDQNFYTGNLVNCNDETIKKTKLR